MNANTPNNAFRLLTVAALILALIACGGGGSGSEGSGPSLIDDEIPGDHGNAGVPGGAPGEEDALIPGSGDIPGSQGVDGHGADTVLVGAFIDSAVVGVTYRTQSQSGVTNANGEFVYRTGEMVTFSIGDLEFPAVAAAEMVTPIEMAFGSADPHTTTTNIARLLQTLDIDGNPDNGIVVSGQAAASATHLDFTISIADFERDPACINLVANSGSVNTSLISAEAANQHLAESLGDGSIPGA